MIRNDMNFRGNRASSLRHAGLFLAITSLLVPAIASAEPCPPGTIRDYAAPLAKLPKVRTIRPGPNNLPFGPSGLMLIAKSELQTGVPLLVVGDESPKPRQVGFALVNSSSERPGAITLNWKATARLIPLAKRSGPVRTETTTIGSLRRHNRRQLTFPVPKMTGMYLIEVQFRSSTGVAIGKFGSYFRAVAPSYETQIALSAPALRAGDTLDACLQNFGSASVEYGEGFSIEVFEGGSWTTSPVSPSGAVSAIGLISGPGAQSPLNSFRIPPGTPPGKYRYVWHGSYRGKGPFILTPEFEVLP